MMPSALRRFVDKSMPPTSALPSCGTAKPLRVSSKVVLPAPLGLKEEEREINK
jgi:hypothetical protein